jgi:hypothetical protein
MSRDQKNELFGLIQNSFDKLLLLRELEQENFKKVSEINYNNLKSIVEIALQKFTNTGSLTEKKEILISAKSEFRGLKLLREQREELYSRLQSAFDELKNLHENQKKNIETESLQNYLLLKQKLEDTLAETSKIDDFNEARKLLSSLHEKIRAVRIGFEQRTELVSVIQNEFERLRKKHEEEKLNYEKECAENYNLVEPQLDFLLKDINNKGDLRTAKKNLIDFQYGIRGKSFLKEQRDEIWNKLRGAFDDLNRKLDGDKKEFERESEQNYKELKKQVDEGYKQANESVEYKKTRNFLKTVQDHFRGIKLKKDDREELYKKLQLSFSILNGRVNEYFRNKKKFWDIKMQFRIANLEQEIFTTEGLIEEDHEKLSVLNDQLDDLINVVTDNQAVEIHKMKIRSVMDEIDRKQKHIRELEEEIEEINTRLNPEENNFENNG